MPTYGYQCEEHKHEFSVFQAMKDDPIKVCPTCGSPVKRLLYPVGIVFKGSGWYINDSRPPDKSESGASDKPNEKPGDKSGDGKDASAAPKTDGAGSSDTSGASGDKGGDKATPAPAPAATSSPASGASPAK